MKTIKLYKKYKKLINGGDSLINPQGGQPSIGQTVGSFLGPTGASISGVSQIGTGVASAIQQSNQDEFGVAKNENLNLGAGIMGSMADPTRKLSVLGDDRFSTGEKLASFIPGGIGTIAYGVMKSKKDNESAKKEKEQFLNNERLNFIGNQRNTFNQAVNNGFQVQGNMNAQKYAKNGGVLSTMYKNGGNVQQLSKTNVQFKGNSHENGGIKEPLVNGVRLDGTEVEGNESMSTSNGQKFVFSENLGFAQQHKPLARAMGKIEKYLKSNPNDPIRKRTLNSLKEREEQLKVKQEETKEALGLENNLGEMGLGGKLKTFFKKNKISDNLYYDESDEYNTKNKTLNKDILDSEQRSERLSNIKINNLANQHGLTVDEFFEKYPDEDTYDKQYSSKINTEMKLGGAIKRKDGVYIDREGVMKYPLKNGGMVKYANGGIDDPMFQPSANVNYYLNQNQPTLSSVNSIQPNFTPQLNKNITIGSSPVSTSSVDSSGVSNSGFNVGTISNLVSKIMPYTGAFSNALLNEKARKMTTPKEALPNYVKYKPVDYSASKIEADQQRRQLNKSLTQNVTNSAVAAALKAKNLGTTIGAKNLINQEETNVNTEGINRINLVNNQIQQRRNQIDVENRDRDYNKEQRYLTQKGEIANNFSDIYQKQGRDQRLEGLENRKIDVLSKYDTGRGVHEREIIVPSIVDKQSRGQSLSKQEQDFFDKNPDLFKRNGGIVKKTNKLYNKLKK